MINKVVLMGRLTRDPEYNEYGPAGETKVARYTLAVDRPKRRDSNESAADFIPVKSFGRGAEFASKWLKKGMKIAVTGRIQTGSYAKQDGTKVYTYDVIADEQEFAESRGAVAPEVPKDPRDQKDEPKPKPMKMGDDFLDVPADIEAELPFA